jgi:hypothetical protein
MKKQQITVLLLICLFSQNILSAVWVLPNISINCESNHQTDCVVATTDHLGHNLPMIKSSIDTNVVDIGSSDLYNSYSNLSFSCDHCLASCQSVIPTNNLVSFISRPNHLFDGKVIFAVVDTFSSTLYRPPIII